MTKRELLAALANVPDDTPIVFADAEPLVAVIVFPTVVVLSDVDIDKKED
jgi:hypothetical protein